MCPSKPLRETVTPRVKFPPCGWELSGGGGGGQGQSGEVMLQNLTLPPGPEARRAAFQELRPGAGRPHAGHCSPNPILEAPWSLGCSP